MHLRSSKDIQHNHLFCGKLVKKEYWNRMVQVFVCFVLIEKNQLVLLNILSITYYIHSTFQGGWGFEWMNSIGFVTYHHPSPMFFSSIISYLQFVDPNCHEKGLTGYKITWACGNLVIRYDYYSNLQITSSLFYSFFVLLDSSRKFFFFFHLYPDQRSIFNS